VEIGAPAEEAYELWQRYLLREWAAGSPAGPGTGKSVAFLSILRRPTDAGIEVEVLLIGEAPDEAPGSATAEPGGRVRFRRLGPERTRVEFEISHQGPRGGEAGGEEALDRAAGRFERFVEGWRRAGAPVLWGESFPRGALRIDGDGVIRVGPTRVPLEAVVGAFWEGETPEGILERYETLELAEVYLALGWYLRHREEADAYLARREREAGALREEMERRFDPAGVRARLRARLADRRAADG
jgi:uncharacterized protein (DUF433 family)